MLCISIDTHAGVWGWIKDTCSWLYGSPPSTIKQSLDTAQGNTKVENQKTTEEISLKSGIDSSINTSEKDTSSPKGFWWLLATLKTPFSWFFGTSNDQSKSTKKEDINKPDQQKNTSPEEKKDKKSQDSQENDNSKAQDTEPKLEPNTKEQEILPVPKQEQQDQSSLIDLISNAIKSDAELEKFFDRKEKQKNNLKSLKLHFGEAKSPLHISIDSTQKILSENSALLIKFFHKKELLFYKDIPWIFLQLLNNHKNVEPLTKYYLKKYSGITLDKTILHLVEKSNIISRSFMSTVGAAHSNAKSSMIRVFVTSGRWDQGNNLLFEKWGPSFLDSDTTNEAFLFPIIYAGLSLKIDDSMVEEILGNPVKNMVNLFAVLADSGHEKLLPEIYTAVTKKFDKQRKETGKIWRTNGFIHEVLETIKKDKFQVKPNNIEKALMNNPTVKKSNKAQEFMGFADNIDQFVVDYHKLVKKIENNKRRSTLLLPYRLLYNYCKETKKFNSKEFRGPILPDLSWKLEEYQKDN
jgi:hypothetical protein